MAGTRLGRALLVMMVLGAWPAAAMFTNFGRYKDPPVDRLITNIRAYILKHPADPEGYYTLGRLCYLAYSLKTTDLQLPTGDINAESYEGDADHLPSLGETRGNPGAVADEPTLRSYLTEALIETKKAATMDGEIALYWNTLGSILEQAAPFAIHMTNTRGLPPAFPTQVSATENARVRQLVRTYVRQKSAGNKPVTAKAAGALAAKGCAAVTALWGALGGRDDPALQATLERCWKNHAIDAYGRAFDLAWPHDQARLGTIGIAYESGNAFLRLAREPGYHKQSKARLRAVEQAVGRLGNAIRLETPIILSLKGTRPLSSLTSTRAVPFDLDGTGRPQRWTWVQPETGIIVWDPRKSGSVTSGHDLMGNVAFYMFWRDGYAVLDALDDDRDGVLRGDELKGLALWFDRNSNGVSDPGEVIPIEQTGITGLATEPTGKDGEALMNTEGVWLRDGRRLPTYDWIAHEVTEVATRK